MIKNALNRNNLLYREKLTYYLFSKVDKYNLKLTRYFLPFINYRINSKINKASANYYLNRLEYFSKNYIEFKNSSNTQESKKVIDFANNCLNGKLPIFEVEINDKKINWNKDYRSGYIWKSGKFFKNYIQVNLSDNSDVKFPRELSRSHHILKVSQAYAISKDEKYAKYVVFQLDHWINSNPFMRSINWGCAMDVSIRAVNWTVALSLIRDSKELKSSNLAIKIIRSIYGHLYYLNKCLRYTKINNHNHYLSELSGIIYLGILFKETKLSNKILYYAINEFYREIRMQILPSGVSYERSTNYHRLVLEIITHTIILLDRNKIEIPQDIWYRLEKMFEFTLYYTMPNGDAPIVGDQDDGRFLPFGVEKNNNHQYLLSIGATLFNRGDFKKYSDGFCFDCVFMFGQKQKGKFNEIQNIELDLNSKSFSDAGFYIIRDKEDYCFINNSGMGRYSELESGTHTHSDLLSFVLYKDRNPIFIDSGTYLYSANPKERMKFRSTNMHNTAEVDDLSQNTISKDNLWGFERDSTPNTLLWDENLNSIIFSGEHSGYLRLKKPINHQRSICFSKENKTYEIIDKFIGEGKHKINIYFHLHYKCKAQIINNNVEINTPNKNVKLEFYSEGNRIKLYKYRDYVSESYGSKIEADVIRLTKIGQCPMEVRTIIV